MKAKRDRNRRMKKKKKEKGRKVESNLEPSLKTNLKVDNLTTFRLSRVLATYLSKQRLVIAPHWIRLGLTIISIEAACHATEACFVSK